MVGMKATIVVAFLFGLTAAAARQIISTTPPPPSDSTVAAAADDLNIPPPISLPANASADELSAFSLWERELTVNTSVDPCEDFSAYACAGQEKLARRILQTQNTILERMANSTEPESNVALQTVRAYMQTCTRAFEKPNEIIAHEFLAEITKSLPELHLETLLDDANNSKCEVKKFEANEIASILAKMQRDFGVKFYELIFIPQGTVLFFNTQSFKNLYQLLAPTYLAYIERMAMFQNRTLDASTIAQLNETFAALKNISAASDQPSTIPDILATTLNNLTAQTSEFDFKQFFAILYENATTVQTRLATSPLIYYQSDMNVFNRFVSLFNEQNHQRALFLLLNSNIYRQFLDLESNKYYSAAVKCANQLTGAHLAFGRLYADYLSDHNQTLIETIMDNLAAVTGSLLAEYRAMFDDAIWLDEGSREAWIAKLNSLKFHLAFNPACFNDSLLERYNEQSGIKYGDSYTQIRIKLNKLDVAMLNAELDGEYETSLITRAKSLLNYNAINFASVNVGIGILSEPFYTLKYPTSAIYGLVAYVIGHEIGHTFDPNTLPGWYGANSSAQWANASLEYSAQVDCLLKEYASIQNTTAIAMFSSIGELWSDNTGLHAAYRAFKKHIELNGAEPHVRDRRLRAFTDEQLFFISGARFSCGDTPPYDGIHPPTPMRFVGMLRNSGAFRDAFNCPLGSNYAPDTPMCATLVGPPRPVVISK